MEKTLWILIMLIYAGDLPAQDYNVSHGLSSIEQVYAPVVVGKPPVNAAAGLVKLDNGEIRHYPLGSDADGTGFYTYSPDKGLTWNISRTHAAHLGANFKSPNTGEYMMLLSQKTIEEAVYLVKTTGGMDSGWSVKKINSFFLEALREPIVLKRILPGRYFSEVGAGTSKPDTAQEKFNERILVGGSRGGRDPDFRGSKVFYTDDDGTTWNQSDWVSVPDFPVQGDHKSTRAQNNGLEPTLVQLNDGRVWMIMRTSHDNCFEAYSSDFGETWSAPVPSRFFGTNTMPTMKRLKDGRLLFLWCNSTPLPEGEKSLALKYFINYRTIVGARTTVFTNRDAIHAAISDDDGKTWKGFRELYLNVRRNDGNYADTGGVDRSVHQTQLVEVGDNKVLVSCGQHPLHRVIFALDLDWLYENERIENFSEGLKNWSIHQYISGEHGHAALNRTVGAHLVANPENPQQQVLKVCNPMDSTLVIENQGAVWNFPNGKSGEVTTNIYLAEGFKGGSISLIDRWFNPVDTTAHKYAMYNLFIPQTGKVGEKKLAFNKWHEVKLKWTSVGNDTALCEVFIESANPVASLTVNRKSMNGISYIHYQSRAKTKDTAGFLIKNVHAKTN